MQKVFKCIQVYFNRVSVGEDASVVVRESEVLNICAEIFFNVYTSLISLGCLLGKMQV